MRSVDHSINFTGYLPCSDKQLFDYCNGQLRFGKRFNSLWFDLAETGPFVYKSGFDVDTVPLPPTPVTLLVGTSFLTDPDSIVRVVLFDRLNTDGPITTDGFQLDFYNEGLDILVEWKVRPLALSASKSAQVKSLLDKDSVDDCHEGIEDVKIGFYSSANTNYDTTGNLTLICGDKGASIFTVGKARRGSFRCQTYSRMFVALDRDVQVILKVTGTNPKVYFFPTVTPNQPYTKFITVDDRTLPVYTIVRTGEETADKQPSPIFAQVAAIIQAFLQETALTIILWSDDNAVTPMTKRQMLPSLLRGNLQQNQFFDVPSLRIADNCCFFSFVTRTDAYTEPPHSRIRLRGATYTGFNLVSPTERQNPPMYPFISYTFSIRNMSTRDIVADVRTGILTYAFGGEWDYYTKLNPQTGAPNGITRTAPARRNIPGGATIPFLLVVFTLPVATVDIVLEVTGNIISGTGVDNMIDVVFNQVNIEYGPLEG